MVFLAGALVAIAQIATPAATPATPPVEDKIVCKRNPQSYETGSRTRPLKKICMRQSQWKAEQRDTDLTLKDARERDGSLRAPQDRTSGAN